MTDKAKKKREPIFSPEDRSNLRWLWLGYLKKRAPWLGAVLLMILIHTITPNDCF